MHKYSEQKVSVAVVGARGYSGLELVRLLLKHPGVKIAACLATDAAFQLSDYLPEAAARAVPVASVKDFSRILSDIQVVFLATPAEASIGLAQEALARGVKVIDLSGAFRLSPEQAAKHYGVQGEALKTLADAQYGLVPWAGPLAAKTHLLSNPGCYATSVLMALIPLVKEGLIDADSIVVDAKSGATGAGRKAAENLLFCEVDGECLPYKVGDHQHLPEIIEALHHYTGVSATPAFSTHLLPVRRGIISSIYARVANSQVDETALDAAYAKAYSNYPLARWGRIDPKDRFAMSLKRIAGSARTEIRYTIRGKQIYLFSLIDNLLKGAASQAVENFNRMQDFPVQTALEQVEGVL